MACLYNDTLELIDPAAGRATASVSLPAAAYSVHEFDGDIIVLGFADDGAAVHVTRLAPDGEDERWTQTVELDVEESLAMTGSYAPVVQEADGRVLLSVGQLQLALDAASGTVVWQGIAQVLSLGPDAGLVSSAPADPLSGVLPEPRWLDGSGDTVATADGLSWWPAAANSGLVPGPLVADDGGAIVGVQPDGSRSWQVPADPEQLRAPMVRADDIVVVQDTAGAVIAVEPRDGQVRWRNDAGSLGWGARGWGALTDGQRMVVRAPEGVLAVDLTDGAPLWQVDVPSGDDQVWELVSLEPAIVAVGQRTISALLPPAS